MLQVESVQNPTEGPALLPENNTIDAVVVATADQKQQSPPIEEWQPPLFALVSQTANDQPTEKQPKKPSKPRKPKGSQKEAMGKRIPLETIISSLTDPNTGQFPHGVSPKQLLQYSESLPEEKRPNTSKNHLQVQLSRKAAKGTIVRLQAGGLYTMPNLVGQNDIVLPKAEPKTGDAGDSSGSLSPIFGSSLTGRGGENNSPELGVPVFSSTDTSADASAIILASPKSTKRKSDESRPKRKRTKKEIGPEFVTYASDNKPRTSVCEICLQPRTNLRGEPEHLLTCKDCASKVHPGCLGFSRELANACRKQSLQWQCYQCKVCTVCASAEDADTLLLCDGCDKAFHMGCMKPAITEKPPGKWYCDTCKKHKNDLATKRKQRNSTTSPREKATNGCAARQVTELSADHMLEFGLNSTFPSCDCEASSILPDLSSEDLIKESAKMAERWTAQDVSNFVAAIGFDSVASVFLEQEIDGQALLLLKRNDVLSRLSLKLGPALKLYRRIFALQAVFERLTSSNNNCDLMNNDL